MIMVVEGDKDVRMMFKGNDEHGYLYAGGKDSLRCCVSKGEDNCGGDRRCC